MKRILTFLIVVIFGVSYSQEIVQIKTKWQPYDAVLSPTATHLEIWSLQVDSTGAVVDSFLTVPLIQLEDTLYRFAINYSDSLFLSLKAASWNKRSAFSNIVRYVPSQSDTIESDPSVILYPPAGLVVTEEPFITGFVGMTTVFRMLDNFQMTISNGTNIPLKDITIFLDSATYQPVFDVFDFPLVTPSDLGGDNKGNKSATVLAPINLAPFQSAVIWGDIDPNDIMDMTGNIIFGFEGFNIIRPFRREGDQIEIRIEF